MTYRGLFLALALVWACAAQTVFHTPGSQPGQPLSTPLCNPFSPGDQQTLIWSASRGCWTPGSAVQVNSDWNATSGVAFILNKPATAPAFNPFSATSGLSSMTASWLATGHTATVIEPGQATLPGTGNMQVGFAESVIGGGNSNPAAYGNIGGRYLQTFVTGGSNIPNNSNKSTLFGLDLNSIFPGSGQHFGLANSLICGGAGDCFPISNTLYYSNRTTAWGDEGVKGTSDQLIQQNNVPSQAVATVVKSACAITALASSVTESTSNTDVRSVTVTGDASNCKKGDWLDIDNGVLGINAAGPSGDTLHESIMLAADAAGGVIQSLFKQPHSSGAPVSASPVLMATFNNGFGQDQFIADTNGPSVTGTCTVSGHGAATITWAGTSLTSTTVGGDVNFPGMVTIPDENFTQGSFSSGSPLVTYYAIQAMSATTITLYSAGYIGVLTGTHACTIWKGGESSQLVPAYSSSGVAGLVMRSTSGSWTAGHTVLQPISPYSTVNAGYQIAWTHWGPIMNGPPMVQAINLGFAQADTAMRVPVAGNIDSPTAAGFKYGFAMQANSANCQFCANGKSLNGQAVAIANYAGSTQSIAWDGGNGYDQGQIYSGTSGQGLVLEAYSSQKVFFSAGAGDNNYGFTIDFSNVSGASHDVQIPALALPGATAINLLTNFDLGPGPVNRTIPNVVNNEVDIGTLSPTGLYESGSVLVFVAASDSGNVVVKQYALAVSADNAVMGWRTAVPERVMDAQGADSFDYALDVDATGGALGLRLRRTVGTDAPVTAQVTIYAFNMGSYTWTPSTATSSVVAPTAWLPSTVLTQYLNKVLLTNATGYVATFDPAALTASANIALPLLGGTLGVMNSATPADNATCSAGQLWFDASYIYICTTSGTVKRATLATF